MVQLTLDPTSLILSQFSDPMNSNNTLQLINDFSYSIERGIRYNDYAQLRESKLQSKRLKLCEIESLSEIPTSDYTNSEEIEIPKSEYSPILKKSVGNDRVSAIPKPGFLRESVSFPVNSLQCEENVQICEIPKSEYSPILKKSVKFHGDLGKLEGNDRGSAIPKPGFIRKSVSFPVNSLQYEENDSPPLKKSMKFQEKKHGYSPSRKENISNNVNRIPKVERSVTTPPYTAKRERIQESASRGKMVNSVEKQSSETGRKKMMMGRKSYASIEELKGLSIVAGNAINNNNNNNGEIRGRKSNVLRKSTIFTTKYY